MDLLGNGGAVHGGGRSLLDDDVSGEAPLAPSTTAVPAQKASAMGSMLNSFMQHGISDRKKQGGRHVQKSMASMAEERQVLGADLASSHPGGAPAGAALEDAFDSWLGSASNSTASSATNSAAPSPKHVVNGDDPAPGAPWMSSSSVQQPTRADEPDLMNVHAPMMSMAARGNSGVAMGSMGPSNSYAQQRQPGYRGAGGQSTASEVSDDWLERQLSGSSAGSAPSRSSQGSVPASAPSKTSVPVQRHLSQRSAGVGNFTDFSAPAQQTAAHGQAAAAPVQNPQPANASMDALWGAAPQSQNAGSVDLMGDMLDLNSNVPGKGGMAMSSNMQGQRQGTWGAAARQDAPQGSSTADDIFGSWLGAGQEGGSAPGSGASTPTAGTNAPGVPRATGQGSVQQQPFAAQSGGAAVPGGGKGTSALDAELPSDANAGPRLRALRERRAAEEREASDTEQIEAQLQAQVDSWGTLSNRGSIRVLLANLHKVVWPDSGWKEVPMSALVRPEGVRKAYRLAIIKIHPDKVSASGNLAERVIARKLFAMINEAWEKFKLTEYPQG